MKLPRILLLAIPLLLLGAVLTPLPAYAQCGDQPQLVGTWEWVSTAGPPGWPVYTPVSEGKTLQLEFMETGELRHYENEALNRVTSWQPPTCEYYPFLGQYCWSFEADSIEFVDDYGAPVRVWVSGDELGLIPIYADAMGSGYVARPPVAVSESSWGRLKRLY